MRIRARHYQQFDADLSLEAPGEGYGGWHESDIVIAPEHTAIVVMHAWDAGTPEQYPGWYRCVEYIPRANAILRDVFPRLLSAIRPSPFRLYHVVGGGDYYSSYPGYARAKALAGPEPEPLPQIESDPVLDELRAFRSRRVFVGKHNEEDVNRGFANLRFPPEVEPLGDEGIAENAHQLLALCRADGVNHLIYTGFAINWCLLLSPGGMHDMSRRGVLCSAIPEATTAVENKETARQELCKQIALWRLALAFGFVFGLENVLEALRSVS